MIGIGSEERKIKDKWQEFKLRFGWIIQMVFLLLFILLFIYLIKHIDLLMNHPCNLCEAMNYTCFKPFGPSLT